MAERENIAESLLERAQKGEVLSKDERQHAIAYLLFDRGDIYPTAMLAQLFNVATRTIQYDLQEIREQVARDAERLDLIADVWACLKMHVAAIDRRLEQHKSSMKHSDWLAMLKERRETILSCLDRLAAYKIERELREAKEFLKVGVKYAKQGVSELAAGSGTNEGGAETIEVEG